MLHALNFHTTNLKTKEDLKIALTKDIKKIDTNIDEIYQNNLKSLYSEIIRYSTFAQEHMTSSFQLKKVGDFKRCSKLIIEVLKDIRDIQRNVNFYLKSKNEYIKKGHAS